MMHSCVIRLIHAKHDSFIRDIMHVCLEFVEESYLCASQMNESCRSKVCHVKHEWVMSRYPHIKESCTIAMKCFKCVFSFVCIFRAHRGSSKAVRLFLME